MEAAITYKKNNPSESLRKVAARFNVSHVTLHDRLNETHLPSGIRTVRRLSVIQEEAILAKINQYAYRGTLLTPRHVRHFAQSLSTATLGINWTSTFLSRHRDRVSSKFYRVQEIARIQANTSENRVAFLTLVKETLETGDFRPENIYNVDEVGFDLSGSRKIRRVGPRDAPIKSQAALSDAIHITVVATISTSDTPVPPFIIYPGTYLMQDWTRVRDPTPNQLATITNSGYINTYTMQQWLTECFDPFTRDRAAGNPGLLILDGHETHTNIDFLDACWDRNIICRILPAHLSGVFQPLDVNFFNDLKLRYYEEISDYQLGCHKLRRDTSITPPTMTLL
ncbi:hypothetical protein TREMEDRAFT_35394 [Tremella mesenterica DSM 1558]|uniref:uncharacterized protein n=1 Tax=Tremella mesenterica (strain ATCC 24925 / CBS 8224 / DSM 1558 / NBRC 9311 / NRRL Y-6157 / RJB 2259-6 / UBC 559-6) TaxID=578456 RepID=UPI00032C3C54|nr:uncharacterized protein TREMEDRAFT_35394 [Tremella mesenterica DSM 1558]EIW66170.1 hypothetical protein TREMEDRAFT_35394 [Tremella mesenterica DSM 1558]